MSILLFRVDERLIHGQVSIGWGSQMRFDRYVVVDDELAASDWEKELYVLGLPEGSEGLFVSTEEARRELPRWREDKTRSIVLTRDLATMVALARGGSLVGETVNLGGIHHGPGREEVLSYLYLDDTDRDRLRELERLGADVHARDLPGSTKVTLKSILAG